MREDGSLLMLDRGSHVWIKENDAAAFVQPTEARMVPTHMPGDYVDPVVSRTEVQYRMLVNDWRGRLAYHMRTKVGRNSPSPPDDNGEAVGIGFVAVTASVGRSMAALLPKTGRRYPHRRSDRQIIPLIRGEIWYQFM